MNITFRQLSIFESAARHLSFTRAAEELHLTQPAISLQIKQLERSVGLPLFEQLGKKIHLTAAGRELLVYAETINDQLEECAQVMEEMKGVSHGSLTVTVASTANYFVPRLLATFIQQHANVAVSLDVTNRDGLLNALSQNESDLVIMGQPPEGVGLVAESFLRNPLVIIAPPIHPLATTHAIPLRDLENETFLVRERGSGTRSAMERCFADHAVELSNTMEMSSTEAIKQGVEAGLGLGLLSAHTLEMELALNRLVVLDVEGFPEVRDWFIVHREGKRLSAVAQAFREFVLKDARALLDMSGLPGMSDSVA